MWFLMSELKRASAIEFLSVLRNKYVAISGGIVSVAAGLVATFVPRVPNPVAVGSAAVVCFVLSAYAIWASERNERVPLADRLRPRPYVIAEYSVNATEEEPELSDTLRFENIGDEMALGIQIATEPAVFRNAHAYMHWPVNRLAPGHLNITESIVQGMESMLNRIYKEIQKRDGRSPDNVRLPLRITYSDRQERLWVTVMTIVHNGYGTWIEDTTGRDPYWTDLSGLA